MKRLFSLLSVWVAGLLLAIATPISEQTAKSVGQAFLAQHSQGKTRAAAELTRALTGVVDGEGAGVYVFNTSDAFVIVSADDHTIPVFGYSDAGPYVADQAPVALKEMLRAYDKAVRSGTRAETIPIHTAVEPMLVTRWDQVAPYNLQCPEDEESGEKCMAGCAAIAITQVMYYHQYPSTYAWSNMKTSYSASDTGESVDAVAKLVSDCGEALFMEYGKDSSGAYNFMLSEVLRYDFGYAETTEYVERSDYSVKEWDKLIYQEISEGRPVIYGGQSISDGVQTGHSFVVDGYDGNGYYHVNWGWGGMSNGFFHLAVMNPDIQGAGGNAGSSGYSFIQSAVIGIQHADKPMEKTARLFMHACTLKDGKTSYTRSSVNSDFPSIVVSASMYNMMRPEVSRDFDIEFALYKDGKKVKTLDSASALTFKGSLTEGWDIWTDPLSLGKDLADGSYEIRVFSRVSGTSEWSLAMMGYTKYIELIINGLTMTVVTHAQYNERATSSFAINSVKVSENNRIGKRMTITVNLTDKNLTGNAPIYLWGNADMLDEESEYQLLTGVGCNLDPGETGDVVFDYTPGRTGNFKFILSGSSDNCDTPLYTFDATVGEMSMADVVMTMSCSVEGAIPQANRIAHVEGRTITGTFTLRNAGAETYDDDITLMLGETDDISTPLQPINVQQVPVVVPVNGTAQASFTWSNLKSEYYYCLVFYANERGESKPLNLTDGNISAEYVFYMTGSTGIAPVIDQAHDADVYDLRGVYLGKASELPSLPRGMYIINKKKVINK